MFLSVKKKLVSKRGASVTFALLLFLICAMASTVVIISATAAAGRMSGLPDADQRYYSVSSAASLLREAVAEHPVTLVVTTVNTVHTPCNAAGVKDVSAATTESGTPEMQIYVGNRLEDASLVSVEDSYSSLLTDAAQRFLEAEASAFPLERNLTLSADGTISAEGMAATQDEALDVLTVKVYELLDVNGVLTYYISKEAPGDTDARKYTLKLVFTLNRTDDVSSHTVYGPVVKLDSGDYEAVDETMVSNTSVFEWVLTDVNKSALDAA